MSNDTRIAVDVAKAVFELAISDRAGHVARRERLPRALFLAFMAQQPAAVVVMEACGSAHHWARQIQKLGHRVVLLPPHHVRPYIRRNKTDRTDAKGILEASRCPCRQNTKISCKRRLNEGARSAPLDRRLGRFPRQLH